MDARVGMVLHVDCVIHGVNGPVIIVELSDCFIFVLVARWGRDSALMYYSPSLTSLDAEIEALNVFFFIINQLRYPNRRCCLKYVFSRYGRTSPDTIIRRAWQIFFGAISKLLDHRDFRVMPIC